MHAHINVRDLHLHVRRLFLALSLASALGAHARAQNFLVGQGLGPPNPNRVRVFDGTGAPTPLDFHAYGAGQWGVNAYPANTQYGAQQIVTGPGPGSVFGPHLRGFNGAGQPLQGFTAYAYGTLRFGLNVSSGRLIPDERNEVLTGPGPGTVFGPHVRAFDYDGSKVRAMPGVTFFAYFTLRYGVNVTAGDVDGDWPDEILTAPGPGAVFRPQVRGWNFDGGPLTSIAKINFNAFNVTDYGANVAAGDVDGDLRADIVTTLGPGPQHGGTFHGHTFAGGRIAALPGFDVTPYTTLYGGRVGAGVVAGCCNASLLTAPGRDPAAGSAVNAFDYTGSRLTAGTSFTAFPGSTYGANVAAGAYGF